jgi:hypothetical protein
VNKFVTDLFTGPDGRTWSIGRIYSLPMLLSGLSTPLLMVTHGLPVDLAGMAILFPATGAAVMALVTGTNSTEPKADAA